MIPLSLPLAISAVKALVRYRDRVDTILALNEAAAGLPFRLPPAPTDRIAHFDDMLAFFRTETGRLALVLNDAAGDFEAVALAMERDEPFPDRPLGRCFTLYFEAADVTPRLLAPDGGEGDLRHAAGSRPSPELRLAYYVVESHRLSRNRTVTRLLLATADTLLEFAGANASAFIANPRTRVIIETLIDEFAVRHDFDDAPAELIFKRLAGAGVTAVLNDPTIVPNEPAIAALVGALNDVRLQLNLAERGQGDELVSRLISGDGFEALVTACVARVAADPAFLASGPVAREVLSATLNELHRRLPTLVAGDPQAVLSVLEAGLTCGALHVDGLLRGKLGARPLLAAVAGNLAEAVDRHARGDGLFRAIATGEIVGELYRAALSAVAVNAPALATEAGVGQITGDLVGGVASALAATDLENVVSRDTLRRLISGSLDCLARHPQVLARDSGFAARVVEAALRAAAPAVRDGLSADDALLVVEAAVAAAEDNLALVAMEGTLPTVLTAIGRALAGDRVRHLVGLEGGRSALVAALRAVTANPALWAALETRDVARPLVEALIGALSADRTGLVSGEVFVDCLQRVLLAASRRGRALVDGAALPGQVGAVITTVLVLAEEQLGRSVESGMLARLLERAVLAFLKEPFAISGVDSPERQAFIARIMGWLEED